MGLTVRAGVIGAGVFGGHHARKWSTLPGAALTAVYDTHPERAEALAASAGGRGYADLEAFFDAVDVVSITSPAVSHGAKALQALRAGKHIYVEKPLAVTLTEADAIAAEASKRSLVVACGFSERVALEQIGVWNAPEPLLMLEARRLGSASQRNQDVSVVLDLMIHDIDLAGGLAGGAALTVEAEGDAGATGLLDTATAEITFATGLLARLQASRISDRVERTLRLTYPSGVVVVDLVAGTLTNRAAFDLNPAFAASPEARDRLGASMARFLGAVRGGAGPFAGVEEGARALEIALAVEQAATA